MLRVVVYGPLKALRVGDLRPKKGWLATLGPWVRQAAPAAGLATALSVAFFMGLIPKRDYLYPLHVDEWIHLDYARTVFQGSDLGPAPLVYYKVGFQLVLAQLHAATGLDWFALFRWLPPAFFAVTTLLSYVVGRRFGCGLESAFLATLVPTTVRFLGPAFLVPVALGAMALPLLLILLHSSAFGVRHALLSGMTLLFAGITHPTSALLLTMVVLIHALFFAGFNSEATPRQRLRAASLALIAVAVPAAAMVVWRPSDVVNILKALLESTAPALPMVRDAPGKFGWVPLGLFVLGASALVFRGGWRAYATAASAVALLAMIILYQQTYIGYQSLADRAWLHLLLLAGIVGGYGLSRIRTLFYEGGPLRFGRAFASVSALAVLVVFLGASLGMGFQSRLSEPYYHLLNGENLADFQWIGARLSPESRTAVLRTDVAFVYKAVTGGPVFASEAWPFFNPSGREAMYFLFSGFTSEDRWWQRRGITLIYAPHWRDSPPYLDQPRPGVFVPSRLAPPP